MNPWCGSFHVKTTCFKEIMIWTTSSGISNQVRDIYSIWNCSGSVTTFIQKVIVLFQCSLLHTNVIKWQNWHPYHDEKSIIFYEIYVNHPWLTYTFCTIIVFTFYVPCCDVCYDFRMKTMFGSSLPPIVCMWAHDLFVLSFVFTFLNPCCDFRYNFFHKNDVRFVFTPSCL